MDREAAVLSPKKRKRRSRSKGWGRKAKSPHRGTAKSTFKDESSKALRNLEDIKNPFDGQSIDSLKEYAVFMFFACQVTWPSKPIKRGDVYEQVAFILGVSSRFIQKCVLDWENERPVTPSRRGKHVKSRSPMEDIAFRYCYQSIWAWDLKLGLIYTLGLNTLCI